MSEQTIMTATATLTFHDTRLFLHNDRDNRLGRLPETNTHIVPYATVSRNHCVIQHWYGGWQIMDLGSTNGTKLNNEPIAPRRWVALMNGDTINLGGIPYGFAIDDE